jgi:hypothetical protein
MKLKLKPHFENLKITIKHPKIGELTFDSNVNNEGEYKYYFDNGFEHIFESIKKVDVEFLSGEEKDALDVLICLKDDDEIKVKASKNKRSARVVGGKQHMYKGIENK